MGYDRDDFVAAVRRLLREEVEGRFADATEIIPEIDKAQVQVAALGKAYLLNAVITTVDAQLEYDCPSTFIEPIAVLNDSGKALNKIAYKDLGKHTPSTPTYWCTYPKSAVPGSYVWRLDPAPTSAVSYQGIFVGAPIDLAEGSTPSPLDLALQPAVPLYAAAMLLPKKGALGEVATLLGIFNGMVKMGNMNFEEAAKIFDELTANLNKNQGN